MNVRRTAVATVVAAGLLAPSVPAGAANASYALDGRRRTSAKYEGALSTPAIPYRASPSDPFAPVLNDCINEQVCDVRVLKLALPKRVTVGRFRAVVRVRSELNAALALFDKEQRLIHIDEVWRRDQDEPPPDRIDLGEYELEIYVERLGAGTYTLALIDRAGMGPFTASIDWFAHPPNRPLGKS